MGPCRATRRGHAPRCLNRNPPQQQRKTHHANLADAYLARAYLAGANLARARELLDCGTPHGYRVVVNVYKGSVRIWAGCRSLTMKEALAHWKKRKDRKLMIPLLAYVKVAARINKWALVAKKVKL